MQIERKIPRHELLTIAIGGTQDEVERDMDLQEIESFLHKEARPWVKENYRRLPGSRKE